MTRDEIKRRVHGAIGRAIFNDALEPSPNMFERMDAATSAVLAIFASIEDERVAVVADIQPASLDNLDLDPVFSYKRGYHDATLDAIKALRRHGEGLTMAPTAYAALRKIVDCADRLRACLDIDASEHQRALDIAILEGKTLIAESPERK